MVSGLHGLGVVSVDETCTTVFSNTKLKDRGVEFGLDMAPAEKLQSRAAVRGQTRSKLEAKNATEVNRDGLVDVIQCCLF